MSLPSGYVELEYIESTGSQYVDTGFTPDNNTRLVMDFALTDVDNSQIVGSRASASSKAFAFGTNSSGEWRFGYGGAYYTVGTADLERHDVDCNKNVVSLDGSVIGTAISADFTGAYPITIGAVKAASLYYGAARFYSCQIYDNGTLVRNFIPCKNASGTVGLWDDVNSVFYGDAAGGAFVAGPAAEIVELEYIESSGAQYTDTGYLPNQNTRMILDAAFLGAAGSNVAGVRNSATDTTNRFGIITFSSTSKIGAFFRDSSTQAVGVDNERHVFDLSKGGLSVDGTSYGGANSGTFACTYSLVLFGWNNGSGGVDKTASRVYGCQLFELGLLVRDFIPAMTVEGEIGLYDRVFKEFYRNAGTGEFIAGPEMEHEDYTELEYIESDGTQWIDTQFTPSSNTRVVGRVETTTTAPSANKWVFGCRSASATQRFELPYISGASQFRFYFNASYVTFSGVALGLLEFDVSGTTATVNGVSATPTQGAFSGAGPFYIASCYGGTPADEALAEKVFFFDIYEGTEQIRGYVPMLHPSGVAGLWDAVNERFYASATTTDFIAGPETSRAPSAPTGFYAVSESDTELTLTWNPVEDAAGYRLYRSGALLADTAETTFTDTVAPFGRYTYYLAAYNDIGEGAGTSLTYSNVPENPVLYLVTDRTRADVTAGNEKGSYNASDLNRVGAAMNYVADRLTEQGYSPVISPKTDWLETDWLTPAAAKVYLADLAELRRQFAMMQTTPDVPDDMEQLTYTKANNIEKILEDIDLLMTYAAKAWFFSDDVFSGEV